MYSLWLENLLRTLSLITDVFTYHELIYRRSACQPSWSPRGHGWVAERAWPKGRRRLFWEASERAHGGFDGVKWPVRITPHGECHAVQALCWELHVDQPVCPEQRCVEATVMFQFGDGKTEAQRESLSVLYWVRGPRFEPPSRGRPLNGILLNWPVWVWVRSPGPG